MTIFLEIPLNAVGGVVVRGILGRPSRHCVLSCSVMVELRRWRNSSIVTCGWCWRRKRNTIVLPKNVARSTSEIIEANIQSRAKCRLEISYTQLDAVLCDRVFSCCQDLYQAAPRPLRGLRQVGDILQELQTSQEPLFSCWAFFRVQRTSSIVRAYHHGSGAHDYQAQR